MCCVDKCFRDGFFSCNIYMNTNTRVENSILIKHDDMFFHVDNMTIGCFTCFESCNYLKVEGEIIYMYHRFYRDYLI